MGVKSARTQTSATKKKQVAKKQLRKTSFWGRHRRLCKWLIGIFGTVLVLLVAAYIAFQISPWPNALLIRHEFDKTGIEVSNALEKHVPAGVTAVENQQYRQDDKDGFLDVYYPEKTSTPLPVVVWVHGGAWVSGDKDEIDNYLKIVASRGYTVVGVDYTIAPERQYPFPIMQLNEALSYLQQNADRLRIDSSKIVLAGDSAGSQIAAQMANIIKSPSYAREMDINPWVSPANLKGVLLNCGAYDLALPDYNGPFGGFLHTVLWAYSGNKDFLTDPKLKSASVLNYITKDFPPAFITAGNVDPLLAQSTELAKRLNDLAVPASTLFYPVGHQPELNHEYQFNLDTSDGKRALEQMVDFLGTYNK